MRTTILSLSLGISLLGIGCGDDDPVTTDAPVTPPDTRPDASPDAPPTPAFKGYDANEGGELRFEYVRFASGVAGARVTNFLWKDPGSVDYHDYINLNGCTVTAVGSPARSNNWPLAMNPEAERQYLNPGNIIIAGGPQTLTLPRRATAGTDAIGRSHPANNSWALHFGGPGSTDAPMYMTEKTKYDVVFTGSADMPAQVFDDVLYMPADFAIPGSAPYPSTPLPAGTDQTFTWTVVDSMPPASTPGSDYLVQSIVALTGPMGPAVICAEPNDGSITVPAAMIDAARVAYPGGGTLARQTLTHVTRELVDNNGPTGRRIDFITVWCYATPFTVP